MNMGKNAGAGAAPAQKNRAAGTVPNHPVGIKKPGHSGRKTYKILDVEGIAWYTETLSYAKSHLQTPLHARISIADSAARRKREMQTIKQRCRVCHN